MLQGPRKLTPKSVGLLLVALGVVLPALLTPARADAMRTVRSATPEVQRWVSPRSYTTPYALVRVIHRGRPLPRVPITRCRAIYADADVTVMVSTCGHRWNLRARYVSMCGRRVRFEIVWAPRATPRTVGSHRAA